MLASFIAKMRDEEGQGLAEYALILVLVAIVCVAALIFLGGSINNVLCNVGANLSSQPGGGRLAQFVLTSLGLVWATSRDT
jgi:pilus assembly protein Flp/PilA